MSGHLYFMTIQYHSKTLNDNSELLPSPSVNVTCLLAPEGGSVCLKMAAPGNLASYPCDTPGCSGIWRCALCPSGRSEEHTVNVCLLLIPMMYRKYHTCPLDGATAPKLSTVQGMTTGDEIETHIFERVHIDMCRHTHTSTYINYITDIFNRNTYSACTHLTCERTHTDTSHTLHTN